MSEKSKRLMMIYSRLKTGPVTIEMIKSWAHKNGLQISPRTFYRDLADLESSLILPDENLVVTVGEKNRKTWKIEYKNREEPLNEFDMNSYILFRNFLPFPIVSARLSSLPKMQELFYHNFSKSQFENFVNVGRLQITASHFHEGLITMDYGKILDDCIWSIQNKREIELLAVNFDYTSISSHLKFPQTLLPLQILYHRGVVHISGFIKNRDELFIIGLDQIKEYKLTNDLFEGTPLLKILDHQLSQRFGITENMSDEIYEIELEFSESTGHFVQKQFWHTTQSFRQLENGNFLMQLTCGINRELIGWIFQWMSNVKVLRPDVLRNTVLAKYREVLNSYETEHCLISNNSFRQ